MFPSVKLCDIQHIFLLEVEKDFLLKERPFIQWQEWWWLCQVEMWMAFVYHLHVIYDFYPSSSCPSHPKYFLWQKGTELLPNGVCSWKSQTPDVQSSNQAQSNEYPHIKGFCGKASMLHALSSSPFWVFRLPCKPFFNFSPKLSAVASFSLMPSSRGFERGLFATPTAWIVSPCKQPRGILEGGGQAKHKLQCE